MSEVKQNDLGQNADSWSQFWGNRQPEHDIAMWDYYGGRQWILKFTPRYGKTLEAGCGLGRYVFYLSRLGIDIEGVEYLQSVADKMMEWSLNNAYHCLIRQGDVNCLDYPDNCLSGYISLGVIEHFKAGPQNAIQEAFRVLRPGGIAIITTPNKTLYYRLKKCKEYVMKFMNSYVEKPFFQYYYTPRNLKQFINEVPFAKNTVCVGADLFNSINELRVTNLNSAAVYAYIIENTIIKYLGAQSITISVKVENIMYCFLCNKYCATDESLKAYTVPLCDSCATRSILSKYYEHNVPARYCKAYIVNPFSLA